MTVKRTNRKTRTSYPKINPGDRFGRLLVTGPMSMRGRYNFWPCRCDCGTEITVIQTSLNTGNTQSCGCLKSDIKKASTKHGGARRGAGRAREYRIWDGMLQRCGNQKNRAFNQYGGRGITVCDRWLTFDRFIADMGSCPTGMTIDRRDNDGPYSPDNCRWATRAEQARNRSANRWVVLNGKKMIFTDALDALGQPRHRGRPRIQDGGVTHQQIIDELTRSV